MSTTHSTATTTTTLANAVLTAYDKVFEFGLRSEPYFRTIADKHPVQVTNPGDSVVLSLWDDLTAITSSLTENVDPDKVQMGDPSRVTVTLDEYGNALETTRKVDVVSVSNVGLAAMNMLAYNCRDSLDGLIQTELKNSVQLGVRAAGAFGADSFDGVVSDAPAITGITAGDVIKSSDIRLIVATLRQNSVIPNANEGSYTGFIHPMVSADLQAETGAAAWRDPHVYNAGGVANVWNGVVGQYQGVTFIESPRLANSQAGSGTGTAQYRVYDSYFTGAQALAEAVNVEAEIRTGPVVDAYSRFQPMVWYFFGGWKIYRPAALYRYRTGSAARPQA